MTDNLNTASQLETNGYVFLNKAIPNQLIELTQRYASELLSCKAEPNEIINAMSELEAQSKDNFYEFCLRMGQVASTFQIALLPEIINIVKESIKTETTYFTDSAVFFNKIDVKRLQYDWHTEKSYFPNADEVITLWYPWLHNVNVNNGTMILAKGSHNKNHNATRIPVKNGLTQMRIDENDLTEFDFVPCNLDLGSCVLFKLNLAHRTAPNTSGVPRTTLITRFTNYTGKFNSGWNVLN